MSILGKGNNSIFTLPKSNEISDLTSFYVKTSDEITKEFLSKAASLDSLRAWFINNNELESLKSKITFGQHVSTELSVRDESRKAQEILNKYQLGVYSNKSLFDHLKPIVEAVMEKSLQVEEFESRLFSDFYRDFVHNGLLLDEKKASEVKSIKEELQKLSLDFSTSIADDETKIEFTLEQLKGMPESYLEKLDRNGDKYVITMKYPDAIPIFDNCEVEETRKDLDYIFTTRCPDNIARLQKAVTKRYELAQILGYKSFSDYNLVNRMAKNPENVWNFLNDLKSKLTPFGKKELQILEDMKGSHLNSYDFRYYHNQLKKRDYAVDEKLIQEYFPVDHVLDSILSLYQSIFDLRIEQVTQDVWHPDVKVYSVFDGSNDHFFGTFFVDIFPRPSKYSHAACFQLQPACKLSDGKFQPAIAALVANFNKPTKSSPSLLEHSEVQTLAHELGHVFHVITSITTYSDQQGTNTAWDFVEAPSQMLENFVFEKEVLRTLSSHYKTKEPLPDTLIDNLIAARNVDESLFNLRQLFFGIFDMTLHGSQISSNLDINEIYSNLRGEITLFPHHVGTFGASTFGHIMGGYQSGYYGYLYSLVFASDMYSCFKERGYLSKDVGREYRKLVLEKGGSLDELENVKRFLKREPSNEAFLKHLGLMQ
eukprot:NODE_453_length_7238_cov_1.750245.p1 type:complete len:653 gc:universal NODE_453_length_7238_cov_1.750245:6450-4492(-)